MFSPRVIKLALAITLGLSTAVLLVTTYHTSEAESTSHARPPKLKSKILRKLDRIRLRLDSGELASLRKNAVQQEERELEDQIPKHLPLKVKIRAEKERAFRDLDNPNWLAELEIEVKNTGNKPIYYLLMALHLPEMRVGESHQVFPLRYGRPALSAFSTKIEPNDVAIKPNETYVFRIPTKLAEAWLRHRRNDGSPKMKKLWLSFQEVSFGDGTGFQGTTAAPWPRKRAALGLAASRQICQ